VALVHMLFESTDERRALQSAALVVATGAATLRLLTGHVSCPVVLVEPGTDRARRSRGSQSADSVHLLCVATINSGKGHDILLAALSKIPQRNWRLTCAGSLSRDADAVARVRAMIDERHLGDRVVLTGELDDAALASCYDAADVFVLATRSESYGMAVAEAIAHGLPVVSTATGAIATIVGDGGLVVPPDNVVAFADAVSAVLREPHLRERLRECAARASSRLKTWDQAGDEIDAALSSVTDV